MGGKKEKQVILLIEDERPILEIIRKKLNKNNFEVLTARYIEEALCIAEKHKEKIQAIWLDHCLIGKKTGREFITAMEDNTIIKKEVPIFLVSNHTDNEDIRWYKSYGVRECFSKTDNTLEEIIKKIKLHLFVNLREV